MTRREIAWSVLALLVAAVLVYAFFSLITAKNAYAEQEDFCRKAAQYGIRCAALTPTSPPAISALHETLPYERGSGPSRDRIEYATDELVYRMFMTRCLSVRTKVWREGDMLIVSVRCTRR